MLVGLTQTQQLIRLYQMNQREVADLVNEKIVCPSCKGKLILKNGAHKIPHFAHKSKVYCQSFSEGETAEHLKGKQLLFDWLKRQGYFPIMEAYLPELTQRPDILCQVEEAKLAIEFQCSFLSQGRMMERTKMYQRKGYQVIWILGKRFFPQKKLTARQRLFLSESKEVGYYLWCLDTKSAKIELYYDLRILAKDFSTITLKKISRRLSKNQSFRTILADGAGTMKTTGTKKQEIKASLLHIQKQLYYQNKSYLEYQLWLYQQGKHLLLLPLETHLLPKAAICINIIPVFLNELILSYLMRKAVTRRMLEEYLLSQNVKVYATPLIRENQLECYIESYLKELEALKVVRYEHKKYIMNATISYFSQLEEKRLALENNCLFDSFLW